MNETRKTVVFIHGLWLHATSWQPWVELFERAGYDAIAPGLARGSQTPSRRPAPDPEEHRRPRHRRRRRPLPAHHRRRCRSRRSWSATRSAA